MQALVKNHRLAKSINDAGWYLFREWLKYFAVKFGKVAVPVAPNYTSQECSNCGNKVKKSLSVRTHLCKCGTILDRDENAAINILVKALKLMGYISNTVGHTEINACGEMTLYLSLETVLKQGCLVKQESPRMTAGECQLDPCLLVQYSRKTNVTIKGVSHHPAQRECISS